LNLKSEKQQFARDIAQLTSTLENKDEIRLCLNVLTELTTGFNVFRPYQDEKKVSFFGSAQLAQDHPSCIQVKRFAAMLAERDYMIITGGGEGVMSAANTGAGAAHSFAINIDLPHDIAQPGNKVVRDSPRYFSCYYFFIRKLFFLRESHAVVLAQGGFGTLDETFETLTLLQTGRTKKMPVVFLEAPGGKFWAPLLKQWMPELLSENLIRPADTKLFLHTDNLKQALNYITEFSASD